MPNGNGNVTESKKDLYNSQNDMNNSLQFETEFSNKGECYYCQNIKNVINTNCSIQCTKKLTNINKKNTKTVIQPIMWEGGSILKKNLNLTLVANQGYFSYSTSGIDKNEK